MRKIAVSDRASSAVKGLLLIAIGDGLVARSTERAHRATWARELDRLGHGVIRGVAHVAAAVAGAVGIALVVYSYLDDQVEAPES
jgi:hypothetical protein